jgi:prevent-host-death family protein
MGISDARANMTEVIAEVRLLGHPVVLTRREKPQAVLVSVDFYEQARTDRAELQAIKDYLADLASRDQTEAVASGLRFIQEALDSYRRSTGTPDA